MSHQSQIKSKVMPWSEAIDDRFKRFILGNAPPQKIGSGFLWTEGPVWCGDSNQLLFSDIPNSRVMRWIPEIGVSVFNPNSNYSNGHTRDRQGRLISCEHGGRRVTRTEHDGTVTVIADTFEGKRLNSPNEPIVKSDGSIWFSDPYYGIQSNYEGFKSTAELPCNLYRWDPVTCELEMKLKGWKDPLPGEAADLNIDLLCPNGLAFSPDEDILYVADTGRMFEENDKKCIYAFDCSSDGTLTNKREFYAPTVGQSDGFRVDTDGNVWTSSGEGVHCVSPEPEKKLLGKIFIPETVSNVAFGGRDRFQLFMTSSTSLYMISLNRSGATWPSASIEQGSKTAKKEENGN